LPTPPSISDGTLADKAFEWLEEAIIRGDLVPGSKLDEASLAAAFCISRGPVREAIRRLEGKKLVERIAHSGVRVIQTKPEDLDELLVIREVLEGLACRLATKNMSDSALKQLGDLLKAHANDEGLKAGADYYQRPGDYDFHFRIIQESGNRRLIETLCDDLYHQLRLHRYRSGSKAGRPLKALHEHHQILQAMQSRDAEKAEALMRNHIEQARKQNSRLITKIELDAVNASNQEKEFN
jgi:DNA-binding GntR family transcriptional regulator